MENEFVRTRVRSPKLKIFALAVLCLGLIFGSLFIFKKPRSVASLSYFESLKISPSSLNGNSIWGGGETFETIVSAGGLDNWAAFYSTTNKSSGGLDSSGSISIDGVPYQFSWTGASDFTGNDTIRLYSGHESATITLDTIGAYEKLYVLGTAGGPGEGNYANFAVVVHYTDGTSDETNYRLYDWYDSTPVSGVYKWPNLARRVLQATTSGSGKNKTTTYAYEGSTSNSPYLQSATINVDAKKLVSSVDLRLTGRNGKSSTDGIYCGIFAVTGMVNVSAPAPVETIYVDNVKETTADVHWDTVQRATSYRLDVALDPDFKNILPDYNNLYTQETSLTITGLSGDTTYYTRVRAENSEGQSISSNVVNFTTDPETIPPTISLIANPGLIQIKDDAVIIGVDASGVKEIDESLDGGTTWTKLVDGDRAERTITENGTYCYRAIDNYNNVSESSCLTYSNLDTSKPAIRVDTNGYVEGEWTSAPITMSIVPTSINVGTTSFYYSEDGENWLDYTAPVVYSGETSLDGKKFYFRAKSEAGLYSDVVEVLVRRDVTAPTGEIESSDNSWNQFLNTITFGLFFNETTNFEISAADDLSGVDKIEYLVSRESFASAEEALAASGWKEASGPIAVNPEGDFVLYYKLTDKVGNVSVINTDGVVLDTTNALIRGYVDANHTYELENDATYYLTKKILVSDDRALDSIKVNGSIVEPANNIINLSANQTYIIEARDKAGNVTSLTINTGALSDYDLNITEENFKTSDQSTLENAKAKLEAIEAAESTHATTEEQAILDDLEAKYADILERISALEAEIADEAARGAATPEIAYVNSEEYTNIVGIIEDIKTTIDNDSSHLTIDELNSLLVEKRELEDKLRRLEEVANDLEDLEEIYHTGIDIIKTSDHDELEDLKATAEALLDSNNLTEDERATVEDELNRINELLAQISDALDAKDTEDIQAADALLPGNYTVDDKDELEKAKADLKDALDEFGPNYTDAEVETINDKITAIDAALAGIEDQIWENIRQTTFPTLSVHGNTNEWIPYDVAGISASDEYGLDRLQVSADGGATWELITGEQTSGTYTVTENGTYIFRAVNSFGNETRKTLEYHNIDPVTPIVSVDAHGYTLGTWTNQPITLSATNSAANVGPVALYYRARSTVDGENDWLPYASSILITSDADSTIYEFQAVSSAGLRSAVVEAEVKKDAVVPTGSISIGNNAVNQFLNSITFGLLFTETKTYEMSATDDRSGIDKIEYLVSDSTLDADALKGSTDWRETAGSVSIDPNKSTNVYYRLTDKAGNISVVNLNGVVFDLPGLTDVDVSLENRSNGYLTLATASGSILLLPDLEHRTVDDLAALRDIESDLADYAGKHTGGEATLVDGILADYRTTIAGINALEESIRTVRGSYDSLADINHVTHDDEERIEALIAAITELLTNTHLTVAERAELEAMLDELYAKLARLEEIAEQLAEIDASMENYSLESISKDDLASLEELKENISDLLESTNLTETEREHLADLLDQIDALKERIEEVEQAIKEAEERDKTNGINSGNVTPEDQTSLEDALSGYTDALGVFDSNLSLSELFDINNRISVISSALDILDQVAEFENLISRLPNPEDVNFSSRLLIKAAEGAYNALSEYGRSLVGPSLLAKYRAVLDAYRAYLEGSPLLYAFETLDVFWWGLTTFAITGIFIFIVRRTHRRYSESVEPVDEEF